MNGDRNEVERYMAFCVTNISEKEKVIKWSFFLSKNSLKIETLL